MSGRGHRRKRDRVERGIVERQITARRQGANIIALHGTRHSRRKPKNARIDFETIRTVALRNAIEICELNLPGGRVVGAEYVVKNPKRADRHAGSFKVNIRTGRWADFATNERGGDLIALVAWRYDLSQSEAALRLASFLSLEAVLLK
jgi:hypothetical protein